MVRMFNTLYEHLLVCRSLLKERRRSPTGGLREALEESFGGGVFMPSSPGEGSKTTLEPLLFDFPLPGENDGYCLEWNDPHWGVSCRSF